MSTKHLFTVEFERILIKWRSSTGALSVLPSVDLIFAHERCPFAVKCDADAFMELYIHIESKMCSTSLCASDLSSHMFVGVVYVFSNHLDTIRKCPLVTDDLLTYGEILHFNLKC